MQTDCGINVTLIQSFDFLNSSTSTFFEDRSKFEWTSAEIIRLIHVIVRPILIVIGTIGNCLSFYIMGRTSLRYVSSCFYMSVLALADTSK